MKKRILWASLGIIVVAILGFSFFISQQVADGMTHLTKREDTYNNSLTFLTEHGFNLEKFKQKYTVSEATIPSTTFDHDIPYLEVKTPKASQGAVILVHGLGGTKESVLGQGKMFLDMGYDIYAYDQRNSGANNAKTNTFGVLESKDLEDMADMLVNKLASNQKLVVWGESFGGGTVGIAAKNLQIKIDYIILDSPIANGKEMVTQELTSISKETGLPIDYMLTLGDWNLRLTQGFSLADSDVASQIKTVTTPILIFHSKTDQVVPYAMGQKIYQASPAKHKQFVSVEKGEHALLFFEQTDLYRQSVEEFLAK